MIAAVAVVVAVAALCDVATGQQRPAFESRVARVRVDVIVNDPDGRFVADLAGEDFIVFEDDVRQELLSVQLVDATEGRILELRGAGGVPSEAAGGQPAARGADSPDPSELGAIVFLVDAAGLDGINKYRFADAWLDLIGQTRSLSLPRAVYLIDQQLRLRELTPLTSEPARIREAAQAVLDTRIARPRVRRRVLELNSGDLAAAHFEFERSLYTFDVLAALAASLAGRGGRTALVWVSTGVSLEDKRDPRSAGVSTRILAHQRRFHRAANSANVAVYTVDPSRRDTIDFNPVDAALGTMPSRGRTSVARVALSAWRDPLFNAALETSGRPFVGWAEVAEALGEIRADAGRYYLLTYALPEPVGDGDYHDIRVEVRRPDVRVRARQGYIDADPDAHRDRLFGAATTFPGLADGIDVHARAYRMWDEEREPAVMLGVSIDASALGTEYTEAGASVKSVALQALVTDERGNAVSELIDTVEATGGVLSNDPDEAGSDRALMRRRYRLDLDSGTFDLRVAVLDAVTDRVGGAQLQVKIPDHADDAWFVADPVLAIVDRLLVDERVPLGSTVRAYVEVFGGDRPTLTAWMEPAGTDSDPTPGAAIALPLGGAGIHRGAVTFPSATLGRFSLRLLVEDRAIGQVRSFDFPIEVVDIGGVAPR